MKKFYNPRAWSEKEIPKQFMIGFLLTRIIQMVGTGTGSRALDV